MNRIIILILAALTAAGCGNRKAEQFKALPFPDMAIPGIIEDDQERADFIAEHLWDRLTDPERSYPSDSVLVSGVLKKDVEEIFANWLHILEMTDLKTSEKAIKRMFERSIACERKDTSSNIFETFVSLAEKYLYDPNSPMRNEEYYLHFVCLMADFNGFEPEIRAKYSYQKEMCAMNRIGHKAADFRFTDNRGKIRNLYDIEAQTTLLFFSNPGCDACMNIIEMLKCDFKVAEMISEGVLAVLNIYIDEDLEAWKEYMPIYPKEWYNGFDPDLKIRTDNLYNVRAIPSVYILDKDKKVIMKDAPEGRMMSYLSSL